MEVGEAWLQEQFPGGTAAERFYSLEQFQHDLCHAACTNLRQAAWPGTCFNRGKSRSVQRHVRAEIALECVNLQEPMT
jgi:hypothetical protein